MKIAFSVGDPAGVGLPILLHLHLHYPQQEWLVCTNPELLKETAKKHNIPLVFNVLNEPKTHQHTNLTVVPLTEKFEINASPANTPHTLSSLKQATQLCLNKICDALITLPVHKGLINKFGEKFTGHTEWLAQHCGVQKTIMLMIGEHFKICPLTTHIPLNEVAQHITSSALQSTYELLTAGLQHYFRIKNPKIDCLALNPHAGDDGYLGTEENEILTPFIQTLKQKQQNIRGPYSSDGYFMNKKNTDCILSMYHDQALIPFKQLHGINGINMTLGLPFVRLSVDHGTAFDLNQTQRPIHTGGLKYVLDTLQKILKQ